MSRWFQRRRAVGQDTGGAGSSEASERNNVAWFLLRENDPNKTALVLAKASYTYGDLQRAAAKIAAYLRQAGGQKEDRVVLVADNSLFWVAGYLGTIQAGLTCVPLPTSVSAEHLEFILQTTDCRIALVQSGVAKAKAQFFERCHVLVDAGALGEHRFASLRVFGELRPAADVEVEVARVRADDLAALMFTSGSTGMPRGVMVSHRNICANAVSIIESLGLTDRDRIMTVLPFPYCFGASLLHSHLRVGGSLVLDSRFMYPEVVLERMIETECTGFAGVPSHFQILLRTSGLRKKSFPALRYVQQAGGCLAPRFLRELQEALPKTQIFVMYGQTEATARLSCLPPQLLTSRMGSVGKGIPGVRLRVLNEAGQEVSPHEVGEIVAEGENVTQGYWRAAGDTAAVFRNGKLHTGDMATVDEDGFIYIVDRAKNFLKCGGKRFSYRDVEDRLLEFPCVLEAAVLPTPDDVLGEGVKAFLVPRMPGCKDFEQCLRGYCKEHMPPEISPKIVVVLERLPRNNAGKLQRRELESARPQEDCVGRYYRCAESGVRVTCATPTAKGNGYFRFGQGVTCYGRNAKSQPSAFPEDRLHDTRREAGVGGGVISLPFDLTQVIENLEHELYMPSGNGAGIQRSIANGLYYLMRPLLPIPVRKHLQRLRLRGWDKIAFPRWPVDRSVDHLLEQLLLLTLRASGRDRLPFVWFWPEGAAGGAIVTHDVETGKGRDFCSTVMDIDDSFGIKASFQVVPERRYEVPAGYLQEIGDRGFEVAVQDLNHDGHLYREREEFLARVARINAYGRQWGAQGFRSAVLYRRQDWFDALEFAYDMSVPNVAHLDPQRGGCCTVMPHFVGRILELPVTTTQDYSLFHILKSHSIDLWKRQTELILESHGLASFIVHPDYITGSQERKTFEELLEYLAIVRANRGLWIATPREVNRWWRQRAELRVVEDLGSGVRIEGVGKERARIAYASAQDGRLVCSVAEGLPGATEELSAPACR